MDPVSIMWAVITKKASVFFSGFLGAVVSLKFTQGLTIKSGFVTVLFGAVLAQYTANGVASRFDLLEYQETIGFLIGLFGLSFCAAVIKMFKDADLWSLVKSKWDSWGAK